MHEVFERFGNGRWDDFLDDLGTIRVVDDSSPKRPILGHSTIGQTRGRGLLIVDRLSTDWGVIPNVVGKTVWAELPCDTN